MNCLSMYRAFTAILIILFLSDRVDLQGQDVQLSCTDVLSNGDVILYWNPVADPTGFIHYALYSSTSPGGPYSEIAIISDWLSDSYLHAGAGADLNTVYYYLIINTDTGPLPPSDTLSTKALSPPVIDSVSIDAAGKVIIGWQPAQEPNIRGYRICRVSATIPPTNDSIDYVDGRFNTTYTHQASNPCNGPLQYIINSVDLCDRNGPFPYDTATFLDRPHTTIFLSDIYYDPCTMANTLSWNEYENFDPPLAFTRIYVSRDNSAFELLETVSPGQSSFVHENLLPHTTYEYYVRAFSLDNQKSSTSCRKQVATYNSPSPAFMYTRYVTVQDNEQVSILFYTDTSAHVKMYRIRRSYAPGGPFEEVGTIDNPGEEFISFTDVSVDVNAGSYYYQVEVVDSCGVPLVIANTCRTIFLQVEAMDNMQNVLNWNEYESFDGSVAGYRIYRRINGSPALELIGETGGSTFTYTDNVSSLTGSASRITYLVEAFEGNSNTWGFRESSYSNEVLAAQDSRIYVPNAVLPRSNTNNILKPVSVFVGDQAYEFSIYNRWGNLIFRTSDPGEGWNGTCQGHYVDGGLYVYVISYRNVLNQVKTQKGNVVVIY